MRSNMEKIATVRVENIKAKRSPLRSDSGLEEPRETDAENPETATAPVSSATETLTKEKHKEKKK